MDEPIQEDKITLEKPDAEKEKVTTIREIMRNISKDESRKKKTPPEETPEQQNKDRKESKESTTESTTKLKKRETITKKSEKTPPK